MASAFKIAIVGSGPAGLSAAGRAAQLGLSHVLLEKTDHLSDTIYKYQKGKHVMATPSQLVLRSDMDFDAGKREAVLGTWDRLAAEREINVRLDSDVKSMVMTQVPSSLATSRRRLNASTARCCARSGVTGSSGAAGSTTSARPVATSQLFGTAATSFASAA